MIPIVAMNDYRHFATGPYSRGGWAVRDIVRRLAASERQQYIYIAIYINELLRLKSQQLGYHIILVTCFVVRLGTRMMLYC